MPPKKKYVPKNPFTKRRGVMKQANEDAAKAFSNLAGRGPVFAGEKKKKKRTKKTTINLAPRKVSRAIY